MNCDYKKRVKIFPAYIVTLLICAFVFSGLSARADAALITVAKAGTGTGLVTSNIAGINCGLDCSEDFNTEVTLTATADAGSKFSSWSGCDSATTNQCVLTGGLEKTVTVTFSSLNDRFVSINSINALCSSVNACLTVRGNSGPLDKLTQNDFQIWEDSTQKNDFTVAFSQCPDATTGISITMDYSGSMSTQSLRDMEDAAVVFINSMSSSSQMEIIKFSSDVAVVQAYTSDKNNLIDSVVAAWDGEGGATALYSAVYQGVEDTSFLNADTRAVIAMTDGQDNSSSRTIDETIQFANSKGIQIFSIGLGSGIDSTMLTRLAVETGGKYYEAPSSADLAGIYTEIAGVLSLGYVISFPEEDLQKGRFHTFTVEVGENSGGSASAQYSTTGCRTLTVNAAGGAAGSVISDVGGINFSYPGISSQSTILYPESYINLYAQLAVPLSSFTWTGACTGSVNPCEVKMDADNKIVNVGFNATGSPTQYILTVNKSGFGSGTVEPMITENDDGSNQLSNWYLQGINISNTDSYTLYWELTDAGGERFVNLYKAAAKLQADLVAQGSLVGDGTLILSEQNLSGISGSVDLAYTVDDTGAANTLVSLNMGTLVWIGSSATATHNNGDEVTLQAIANPGATFNNWSGCDTVTGTECRVTMGGSRTVTAAFDPDGDNDYFHTLSVTKVGNGSGNVRVKSVTVPGTIDTEIDETGDIGSQLSNWQFTGLSTSNSDSFILYWELTDSGGNRTVSLYKTAAKATGDLVAQGTLLGDGTIALTQRNASNLSGSVDVVYKAVITESGDDLGQLNTWNLDGISTSNTDSNVLYWELSEDAIPFYWNLTNSALGVRTVSIYNDPAKAPGDLVAQGSLGSDGTITLLEQNGSGITGLVDIISDVIVPNEFGDFGNQVSNWTFFGLSTANTDGSSLYWNLSDVAGTRTVQLFKDPAKLPADLVASGSLVGNGTIALAAQSGSGLSGTVDVTYSFDDTDAGNSLDLALLDDTDANNILAKIGSSVFELPGTDNFNQLSNWSINNPQVLTPLFGIVSLYKSVGKSASDLVAQGAIIGDGTIGLLEANLSGMTGTVDVAFKTQVIEKGDTASQLSGWQFAGKATGSYSFTLSWVLTNSSATRRVRLYSGTTWVADGTHLGDGTIVLNEVGGSGITGTVNVAFQLNDNDEENTLEVTFRDPVDPNDDSNTLGISFNDTDPANSVSTPNFGLLYWDGNTGTATHKLNAVVELEALPNAGSTFGGWGGDCAGTGTCTVTMSAPRSVTATFTRPATALLTVNKAGTGTGVVTANPGTLVAAGNSYTETYAYNTIVTLTATANAGSVFTGWSGACRNTTSTCTLLMNANETTTAHFITANTSTYSDVLSGNWAWPFVESLVNNNISAGCTSGQFCPSGFISRGEMAVLIIKALGLTPATCTGSLFGDVNSSMLQGPEVCGYIEKMKSLNITLGSFDVSCLTSGYFCPDSLVSRGQVAAFILKARGDLPAAACTASIFSDVNNGIFGGDTFCRYIEAFWALGIGTGCGNGMYCPDAPVTRAQMALFLTEAFLQNNESCRSLPVKNLRTSLVYPSIQDAYDDLVNTLTGDSFRIVETSSLASYGSLDSYRPILINLKGGYDCSFIGRISDSAISGQVSIPNGTLDIDSITIK